MKKLFLLVLYILLFLLQAILCLTYPLNSLTAPKTNNALSQTVIEQSSTIKTTPLSAKTPSENIPLSGSYACILNSNTYFYSSPDERSVVFTLPKTYYVKVLDYQTEYCKIEYLYDASVMQKMTGYAKTEQLTFVEYVPKRPYLYYVFDVYYQIGDTQIDDSAFLTQLKVSCVYYGDFYFAGKTYCYVLQGERFGYIPKPAHLSYEENTEYADYLAQKLPPSSSTTNETATTAASPGQIAILVTLCLLVPVVAALILKQSKRHSYPDFTEPMENVS